MSNYNLTEKARRELAEIYPPESIEAIEKALEWYRGQWGQCRPGIMEDGRDLLAIAERARELVDLLGSKSAIARLLPHLAENGRGSRFIIDLTTDLALLADKCGEVPAAAAADKGGRGRPPGTRRAADRGLAFRLWNIYRAATGSHPPRTAGGPMDKTLQAIGFKGQNFERYFREITKDMVTDKK